MGKARKRNGSRGEAAPLVGIIMGSRSDWSTMEHAARTLEILGGAVEPAPGQEEILDHRIHDLPLAGIDLPELGPRQKAGQIEDVHPGQEHRSAHGFGQIPLPGESGRFQPLAQAQEVDLAELGQQFLDLDAGHDFDVQCFDVVGQDRRGLFIQLARQHDG